MTASPRLIAGAGRHRAIRFKYALLDLPSPWEREKEGEACRFRAFQYPRSTAGRSRADAWEDDRGLTITVY